MLYRGSRPEWPDQVVVAINCHWILVGEMVELLGRPANVGWISVASVPLDDLDRIFSSSGLHDSVSTIGNYAVSGEISLQERQHISKSWSSRI